MRIHIKRFLAGLLLFVLIAGSAVFFAPLGPILSSYVETKIENRVDAKVAIEGLRFSLYGGLHAARMTIHPERIPEETILLRDVSVQHRFGALLTGSYQAGRIHIGSVEAAASEGLARWAASFFQDTDISGAFPDLEIGGGAVFLRFPEYLKPLRIERIRLSAKQMNDREIAGTVSFSAGENDVKAKFHANGEYGFIETDLVVDGFDVSFLPAFDLAGVAIDPSVVKIRGVLSGTVTFLTSSRQWIGDLALTGITAGHPDTGLVVTNGSAKIQLTGREALIHGADFHVAGGRVTIPAAAVSLGETGAEAFHFRGGAKHLDLVVLQKIGIFEMFPEWLRPGRIDRGEIGGSASGAWEPEGGFDYHVALEIRDTSGTLAHQDIESSFFEAEAVIQTGGKVTLKRAEARFWEGQAAAAGTFYIREMDLENPDLNIRLENVAQNDVLIAMLPEEVQDGIRFAGPSNAKVGGNIGLTGDMVSLDLTLQAETLAPPALPFVFSNVGGIIRWTTDASRILFDDVTGDTNGSPVRGAGALLIDEDQLASDFTVYGENLPVNRDILDWLNVDTGRWEVDGRFDVNLQARNWQPVNESVIDSLSGINAEVAFLDVSLSHPEYGRVAESLSGRVTQDSYGFDLVDVKGLVFGIDMYGSGRFPLAGEKSGLHLDIHTESFLLSPERYGRLPIAPGMEGLKIDGRASLTGRIEAGKDEKVLLSGDIAATIEDAEIAYADLPTIGASGSLDFRFSGSRLSGSMSLADIRVGKFRGEELSADFTYDAPALDVSNFQVLAYGGSIDSAATKIDTGDKTWTAQIGVSRLNLEHLAKSYEIMGKQAFEGEVQARISLEGRSLNMQAITGKGEAAVSNGRLYSFPLLVAVLSVFDLRLPTQDPVTDAYSIFSIDYGTINVEDLLFTGGSIPIYMEGYIGLQNETAFADQPIYMLVTLARNDGLLDRIPFVGLLKHHTIDFLRRVVLQARVTGTLGDYEVTTLRTPLTIQIQKMWSFLQRVTLSPKEIEGLF